MNSRLIKRRVIHYESTSSNPKRKMKKKYIKKKIPRQHSQ